MKKYFPFIVMILGVLLILIGAGALYLNQVISNPQAVELPDQIAGYEMVVKSEGLRALAEFSQLHRQNFPLSGGSVGTYGLQQNAKLWVAETPFVIMAQRMTDAMRDKIALGNSPFTPSGEIEIGEKTVYQLEGLGQKHFYFQSGNLIIWLAANAEYTEQAIQDTLEFYP